MKRTHVTLLTAVLSTAMLATAGPASAAPKHGSCADFGHAFAGWAHMEPGVVGAGMSELARAGEAAAVIHYEKTVDFYGAGPLCDVEG